MRSFRGKTTGQLILAVLLRVWPLSGFTRAFYRLRFSWPIWYYMLNRRSLAHYRLVVYAMMQQSAVVAELRQNGIGGTNVDRVTAGRVSFLVLRLAAERVLGQTHIQEQIRAGGGVGGKDYSLGWQDEFFFTSRTADGINPASWFRASADAVTPNPRSNPCVRSELHVRA